MTFSIQHLAERHLKANISIPLGNGTDADLLYKEPAQFSKPSPSVLRIFRSFIIRSKCGTIKISDDVSQVCPLLAILMFVKFKLPYSIYRRTLWNRESRIPICLQMT